MTEPIGTGTAAGATVRCTEPESVANLAAVLRLCQTGKMTCSATTRRPSAATVRAVAGVLVAGDFYPDDAMAAFAWPLLVQAGGLARLEGNRLVLTPKGRTALDRPAHQSIRAVWERWPRHAPIDELSRVEQIKGQWLKSTAIPGRRHAGRTRVRMSRVAPRTPAHAHRHDCAGTSRAAS